MNETHVSLAVHSETPLTTKVPGQKDSEEVGSEEPESRLIQELQKYGSVAVKPNMAILSLIGKGLQQTHGMAGKLFSALGDNDINIEMISQGASEVRSHP